VKPEDGLKIGDTVRVDFNGAQMTLAYRAEILAIPAATGDSWVFRNLDSDELHYVSEGCTITRGKN